MCGVVFCVATVALGVEVGWKRLPDGGLEYIIQFEPEMLEALKAGEDFMSDIPPSVRGVRSYRITVGTGEVPREGALEEDSDWPSSPKTPISEPERSPGVPPSEPGGRAPGVASSAVPGTLTPPEDVKPLPGFREKPAAFIEHETTEPSLSARKEASPEPQKTEPPKPWLALTLALAASFGSFGGMLYLGWIAWEYRRRYRGVLQRVVEAGEEEASDETADAPGSD